MLFPSDVKEQVQALSSSTPNVKIALNLEQIQLDNRYRHIFNTLTRFAEHGKGQILYSEVTEEDNIRTYQQVKIHTQASAMPRIIAYMEQKFQ